jgi:hypothetical protein
MVQSPAQQLKAFMAKYEPEVGAAARSALVTLEKPAVRELMAQALRKAREPLDAKAHRRLVIKSVSAKQRPRRHGA